jgi:hypothetical protein
MKYSVETSSGGMVYIPIFIQISSGVQKLLGGDTHTDTQKYAHRQQSDLLSLPLCFQNKESRLKMI